MQTYKRFIVSLVVLVAMTLPAVGQGSSDIMKKQQQMMSGGLGLTVIDGEVFYLFNMAPEFSFGKLGIGLDLNIRFTTQGKIRPGDYEKFGDYLRIIRYVRWGLKGDPLYVRAGVLDYSRLGHGFIVYNYRNSASYDLRRTGIEFDMDFEKFGFETFYSDLAKPGLVGLRGYVKPLKFTSLGSIPIIGGLQFGATYATDLNENSKKTFVNATVLPPQPVATAGGSGKLAIAGVDVGLPIISLSSFNSTLYADYAQIIGFGNGAMVGINFNFSGMGLLTIGAKYERRFLGDQFLPSFFDAMYEHDRYILSDSGRTFTSKAAMLASAKKTEGYYGEILISILNTFNIVGGYQAPVGVKNQGVFHAELQTPAVIPQIVFSAGFDKRNIGPVFKLDENSILYAELGYKPMPYMIVSMLYQWTFAEKKDDAGNVIGYETQKRIEPKVRFVFNF
jgi:hypothetical protein